LLTKRALMLTEMAILVKIRSLFVIEDTPPLTKDRGPRPPCSPPPLFRRPWSGLPAIWTDVILLVNDNQYKPVEGTQVKQWRYIWILPLLPLTTTRILGHLTNVTMENMLRRGLPLAYLFFCRVASRCFHIRVSFTCILINKNVGQCIKTCIKSSGLF
jgi:hypothetical protein